jgi:hypothetical protein
MVPALLGVTWRRCFVELAGRRAADRESVDAIVAGTGHPHPPAAPGARLGLSAHCRLARRCVIIDAAPRRIARLVEGGCASTLAFEMSDGAHRVIVNCGGARAARRRCPSALADGLRTTAAHSTLIVGDSNSTAIHADGTLGRGVAEVELTGRKAMRRAGIEASHDGYARRFGFLHRRSSRWADGRELRGEDCCCPARSGASQARRPLRSASISAPRRRGTPTADGQAALLRMPGNAPCGSSAAAAARWRSRTACGSMPRADPHHPAARRLGESPAGGASVSWALKRAG